MATATASHYDTSKRRRDELAGVIKRQIGVLDALRLDEIARDGPGPGELLRAIAGRVAREDLRVLIMGSFNAGKSTFINALLGQKLLPAKMLPTTAVINEIRFAPDEQKRIVMHPKAGRWKGGDEPFPIKFGELEQYVTIDHSGGPGQPKNSPFEKVELLWPLPLCSHRVEIVDSPGLNDPDSHDKITLDYLPRADAIIYCMPCDTACTRLDMDTIAMLRNQGYSSLIFVLTKFDRVRESAFANGNSEDKEFVRVTTEQLKGLTDLGRRGIFFVDSFHAVLAKLNGDAQELADSGIPDLERELEEYLVRNRFRAKVVKAIVQLRATNQDAQAIIDNRMTMAHTSLRDLEERFRRAQEPLGQLRQRSQIIVSRVELGMSEIRRGVSDRARGFLAGCPGKVRGWIDEHQPSESVSWNPLKMKQSVAALADEYLAYIRGKLEFEGSAWASQELVPWLETELARLFKSVEAMTLDYNSLLRQIRIELDFPSATTGSDIADAQAPSTASKLGGVIYGILTQDWMNAGMVGVFGVKGLLRGIAAQLVAGVVLGIVGLFTPIGLPALLAAIAAALAGGVVANYMSINAQIRSKVAASVEEGLRDSAQQSRMAAEVEKQIDKQLKKLLEAMRRAAEEDANTVDAEVQKALAEKRKGEAEVEREKALLAGVARENREVASAIIDLAVEAKV